MANVFQNEIQSQWALTAKGLSGLQITHVLSHPTKLLRVRSGISEADMSLFELLLLMRQDKWVHHVRPHKPKKKPKDPKKSKRSKTIMKDEAVLPSPTEFSKGDEKVFWLGKYEEDMIACQHRCMGGEPCQQQSTVEPSDSFHFL